MGIPGAEEVAGPEWWVRTCMGDVGVGSPAVGETNGGDSTAAWGSSAVGASTGGGSTAA